MQQTREREPKPMPGECEHCSSCHTDSYHHLDEQGKRWIVFTCWSCGHTWREPWKE